MKILELFLGTGSFTREALKLGHDCTGIDIAPCPPDLVDKIKFVQLDIINIIPEKTFRDYDFVWASPPCGTYSTRGWNRKKPRRVDCKAVTKDAILADIMTKQAIRTIKKNSRLGGVIENPRACMRKQDFIQDFDRVTVTYCQYGFERMKPTDLFFWPSVPEGFEPKRCYNGDPCHIPSPRGSKGSSDARVPPALCREILLALDRVEDIIMSDVQRRKSR